MPAPPPPPPPAMGGLKMPKMASGNPDDRGALLQSIRQGAKLKKAVTVDKSGPYIPGKDTNSATSAGSSNGSVASKASPAMNGGPPMGLGGLFAGGMPKLRPTGMGIGGGSPSAGPKFGSGIANAPVIRPASNVTPTPPQPPSSISSSAGGTLPKKPSQSPEKARSSVGPKNKSPSPQSSGPSVSQLTQVLGQALSRGAESPRGPEPPRSGRGPPPQPPPPNRTNITANTPTESSSVTSRLHNLTTADSVPPPVMANLPSLNMSSIQANKSSLHGTNSLNLSSIGGGSSTSLNRNSQMPSPTFSHGSQSDSASKVINHGKPNVAPKPPGIVVSPNGQQVVNNGKLPQSPKKQPSLNGRHASRSQSVRVPRSPPITPPCPPSGEFPNNGFAPLKVNAFHQSQDSINSRPGSGLAKNTAPPPPMSGSRTLGRAPVRPPAHCPPPPPPTRPLDHPPPPPPHRQHSQQQQQQHIRSNSSPNTGPPQPPVRNSSMRSSELESRFADRFRGVDKFPFPDAFLRIDKTYSSVNNAAALNNNIVNKQQAPMPPITHIQLTSKLWANNSSNC